MATISGKNNENGLVEMARKGDAEAFSKLVALYKDRLFGITAGLCTKMPSETEDVAQETMISAMKHIDSFKANSTFGTWLYRIAANNCWQRMRDAKKHRFEELPDENSKGHPFETASNGKKIKDELSSAVAKALSALPVKQRMAIVLCDIQGLRLAEAAEKTSSSLPAFKSRLHRARNILKKQLKDFS